MSDNKFETHGLRYSADIFEYASLFIGIATPDEINAERLKLEHDYRRLLKVFEVETVTRSGAQCTRVTWEEI